MDHESKALGKEGNAAQTITFTTAFKFKTADLTSNMKTNDLSLSNNVLQTAKPLGVVASDRPSLFTSVFSSHCKASLLVSDHRMVVSCRPCPSICHSFTRSIH